MLPVRGGGGVDGGIAQGVEVRGWWLLDIRLQRRGVGVGVGFGVG